MSLQQSYRRASSGKGIDERINACRQRLRNRRASQRMKRDTDGEPRLEALREDAPTPCSPSPDERRMLSVAEILSEAAGKAGWPEAGRAPLETERARLETGRAAPQTGPLPEVDAHPLRRTGLSLKEEVGTA